MGKWNEYVNDLIARAATNVEIQETGYGTMVMPAGILEKPNMQDVPEIFKHFFDDIVYLYTFCDLLKGHKTEFPKMQEYVVHNDRISNILTYITDMACCKFGNKLLLKEWYIKHIEQGITLFNDKATWFEYLVLLKFKECLEEKEGSIFDTVFLFNEQGDSTVISTVYSIMYEVVNTQLKEYCSINKFDYSVVRFMVKFFGDFGGIADKGYAYIVYLKIIKDTVYLLNYDIGTCNQVLKWMGIAEVIRTERADNPLQCTDIDSGMVSDDNGTGYAYEMPDDYDAGSYIENEDSDLLSKTELDSALNHSDVPNSVEDDLKSDWDFVD